jgi:hypothetical protein
LQKKQIPQQPAVARHYAVGSRPAPAHRRQTLMRHNGTYSLPLYFRPTKTLLHCVKSTMLSPAAHAMCEFANISGWPAMGGDTGTFPTTDA